MTMSITERLKTALNMIQVTPQNYESLNAEMILYLYKEVAEAEKQLESTSAHENPNAEIMTF